MPCYAIELYDASLAGCLAGTGRGNCTGDQAVWQPMRALWQLRTVLVQTCSDMPASVVDSPVLVQADAYTGLERL